MKVGAETAFKPFSDLIAKLFGGPAEELGGILQDSLKVRRFARQLKLYKETQRLIVEAGFEPHRVPDNIAIPLLNAATLEDDDELQRRWAALLANAASPENSITPLFCDLLQQLSRDDALALDAIYRELILRMNRVGNRHVNIESEEFIQIASAACIHQDYERAIDNLVRLRLVRPATLSGLDGGSQTEDNFNLTQLGLEFFLACQPPTMRNELLGKQE